MEKADKQAQPSEWNSEVAEATCRVRQSVKVNARGLALLAAASLNSESPFPPNLLLFQGHHTPQAQCRHGSVEGGHGGGHQLAFLPGESHSSSVQGSQLAAGAVYAGVSLPWEVWAGPEAKDVKWAFKI